MNFQNISITKSNTKDSLSFLPLLKRSTRENKCEKTALYHFCLLLALNIDFGHGCTGTMKVNQPTPLYIANTTRVNYSQLFTIDSMVGQSIHGVALCHCYISPSLLWSNFRSQITQCIIITIMNYKRSYGIKGRLVWGGGCYEAEFMGNYFQSFRNKTNWI